MLLHYCLYIIRINRNITIIVAVLTYRISILKNRKINYIMTSVSVEGILKVSLIIDY